MNGHPITGACPVPIPADPAERLAALFDAHQDRLYRLARRLAASPDDALDLVQEAFLRAARSPNSVPYGSPDEEAWLVRVLTNIRRDQWRKASVRRRHEMASLPPGHTPIDSRDSEDVLVARTAIWQALDILPPRRRAIVVMRELEELPVRAIASLLGITAVTVRWHLAVARRELTRTLKPHFGGSHDHP